MFLFTKTSNEVPANFFFFSKKYVFLQEGDELWTYQTVEANATQLVLNNLDSTSLYEVEMIRLSRDNSTSQLAMSSFRTGACKRKT